METSKGPYLLPFQRQCGFCKTIQDTANLKPCDRMNCEFKDEKVEVDRFVIPKPGKAQLSLS